jgi:hypothetical protein
MSASHPLVLMVGNALMTSIYSLVIALMDMLGHLLVLMVASVLTMSTCSRVNVLMDLPETRVVLT